MVETIAKSNPHVEQPSAASPGPPLRGESAVVWTLWLTYGAFYFCRTNLSAAVPGMEQPVDAGGLGLTGTETGWILASLKIAYGLGQFLNGQLSERVSPRILLALGMFGSAALNVLFGLSTGFYFLLFVWATNGFCQSLGWTPCVRVMANWVPTARRGKAIGIVGTGYQVTLGLTYLIAGQSVEWLGWRGAVYVPAALLAAAGVFMLVCLREHPSADAAGRIDQVEAAKPGQRMSLRAALYWTVYNPTLWLLGLTLGLLNACRYGYFDWGLKHLVDVQKLPVGKASLQFFVIAIGAAAGSYLAGWATDRFFGSRRMPVICLLMAGLGMLSLVYHEVVRVSPIGTMLILVAIGFCIIGPQVLLVGTAPADLAHRGTSAAAAGFVNFMGYMGAATGDVVTGYFTGLGKEHWPTAIYVWSGWAFAGAIVTGFMWRTTASRIGIIPGFVPKLGAAVALAVASGAVIYGGQPLALQAASVVTAIGALGSFRGRWAVVPGLIVAAVGVLVVFTSTFHVKIATWHQAGAMAAYGLAIIAGLMVLIEQKDEPCVSS